MTKIIAILFIMTSITNLSAQKNIAGIWEGKLDVGKISLRVVFHFEKHGDQNYSATMDSPDQGIKGIKCDDIALNGNAVTVQIKKIHGEFEGVLENDSTLNGNLVQGGNKLPLILNRVSEVSKSPHRPQTPRPPFTYNSEDVEYDNADKTVHFGATFTYPKGKGPFPTAIMITGSGQQDRDNTIFEHKSFAVIADYLAKKGIAVLRVDDRQMGKTTGKLTNATSAENASDVEAGLAYLRSRKEVDPLRMGMIGHSEGGLIAAMVASQEQDINFIIMLAGPGVKGSDLLEQQNEDILKSEGVPEDAVKSYGQLYKIMVEDVMAEKDSTDVYPKMYNDFKKWKAAQSDRNLNVLKINRESVDDVKIVKSFSDGFSSGWIKYFLRADPGTFIEKINCKVLALNGGSDIQVNASINLAAIKKALEKSKSPSFKTIEIPGLNHLFQHCKKCTIDEYSDIEETFAPEALEIMWKWLHKNVM